MQPCGESYFGHCAWEGARPTRPTACGQSCPVKASDRGDGCVELAHSHWPGRRLRHACREREIHTSRHAREGWLRSTPQPREELAFTRRPQFFLRTMKLSITSSRSS